MKDGDESGKDSEVCTGTGTPGDLFLIRGGSSLAFSGSRGRWHGVVGVREDDGHSTET